jgi:hypothetical protein
MAVEIRVIPAIGAFPCFSGTVSASLLYTLPNKFLIPRGAVGHLVGSDGP